jgi:hypothetical protein
VEIPCAWAGIWKGSLAFECALMMNARKRRTTAGESCFFLFVYLFFFPELHHDRDAKEHLGALTFLQLTILSSQLKEDDQTQQTTVFIFSRRNIPCRIVRLLDECIGESEHLNRVFFLTSLHFTFSRVPKCTPAKVSLSTSLLALDE